MNATIKDIARRLDISYATVSRALNGRYGVHPKTKENILKMAQEMNYHPNAIARGLVKQHTETIGLVIPDITNPFFPEVARGIEDRAEEQGYSVFLCNTNWEQEREARYLSLLREKRVDGIILAPVSDKSPLDWKFDDRALPLVFVSEVRRGMGKSYVAIDNIHGGYIATRYLINKGYKRIGFFGAAEDELTSEERYQGYARALKEAGLREYKKFVRFGDYGSNTGNRLITDMIRKKDYPDAVFAVNDLFALSVMQGILGSGLRIPGDIAVIGFDDIPLASFPEIMLTTVAQPKYQMGRIAADLLLEQIQEKPGAAKKEVILETELIERGTA
ncbi:MAG TPA: LacI family DNA-binding transcriptional regulator [Desulfomonilia bacterium]